MTDAEGTKRQQARIADLEKETAELRKELKQTRYILFCTGGLLQYLESISAISDNSRELLHTIRTMAMDDDSVPARALFGVVPSRNRVEG